MQMFVNVNYLVHMMQTCKCMRKKADFSFSLDFVESQMSSYVIKGTTPKATTW